MLKIIAATAKELLLLMRDRTGLLVLFLMPAILVVVITLVQENVMELTGQKKTQVLLLDLDQGELGRSLQKQIETTNLEFVVWDEVQKDGGAIQTAVANGDYQVGIVIPQGASLRFQEETARLFQPGNGKRDSREIPDALSATSLQFFVDPGVMAGLRSSVTAQLQMALTTIALEAKLAMFGRVLQEITGPGVSQQDPLFNSSKLPSLFRQPLLALTENQDKSRETETSLYNPVQQNVPAWALFGMFFTAIPIAGSILQERGSGIWVRLSALPVSPLVLFAGKIAAYIGVCLCQFLLIALIGAFLFPYIGLPAFTISMNLTATLITALFSSLAACGFGIFLGMACNSYEQASTLGATSVVAAAAIGGVMVPVYAMPPVMQRLSIISPLNWGLTAFHDLLLRGYSLSAILDDLGRLFLFFIVTALLSWKLAGVRQ
jgi:ABC-2 type transport system permease protein